MEKALRCPQPHMIVVFSRFQNHFDVLSFQYYRPGRSAGGPGATSTPRLLRGYVRPGRFQTAFAAYFRSCRRPLWAMTMLALTSALSQYPHVVHSNSAWLLRDLGSTPPHREQVWEE